jgi:peroxiredoxin
MYKTIASISVILALSSLSSAQTISTTALIDSVNNRLLNTKEGSFSVHALYKSALKTDTSSTSGQILFFENPVADDTLRSFIAMMDGQIAQAYDGSQLYAFNHKMKIVNMYDKHENKDVTRIIKGGRIARIAYDKFLKTGMPPFDVSLYENNAVVEPDTQDGVPMYKLIYTKSVPNQYRMDESDPEWMTTHIIYHIDAEDYAITERSEWIHFLKTPQYYKLNFSKISPLDEQATFERVLNLDSFESKGYELRSAQLEKPSSRPELHYKNGDTLPDFEFITLSGAPIRLDSAFHAKLTLLDFWYKACYPCMKGLPKLNNLFNRYRSNGLEVVGLNVGKETPEELAAFWSDRGMDYLTVFDKHKKAAQEIGVYGYPLAILIEHDSRKILNIYQGYSDDLEDRISKDVEDYLYKRK